MVAVLMGLQLVVSLLASVFGDGLLGLVGGLMLSLPLGLLLMVAAVLAAKQKRWVLAILALLTTLPAALALYLFL